MKKVTLRKLSKIITKVDNELVDAKRDFINNTSRTVFVHDPSNIVSTQLDEAHTKSIDALNRFNKLSELRVYLRKLLGKMNAQHGVNDLVTDLRGIDFQRSIIKSFLNMDKYRLDGGDLTCRLEALSESEKNVTDRYHSYDGSHTFNILTKADVEQFVENDKQLRRSAEIIQDDLESLNSTFVVMLETDVIKSLTDLGILY